MQPRNPCGTSTSLDPQRASEENPQYQRINEAWRFRRTQRERHALLNALRFAGLAPAVEHRFRTCGQDAYVYHSPSTDQYRIRSLQCGQRWCPACQHKRRSEFARWCLAAFDRDDRHPLKFITLTLRSCKLPLAEQINRLKRAFRKLRARALWRKAVSGGVAVVEVTWNAETGAWHPHIHILARADYIPQHNLARTWLSVTLSSRIVDIRAVRDRCDAIKYLGKYLGKAPLAQLADQPQALAEYITALRGARLVIRFGDMTKVEVDADITDDPHDWQPIGSLAAIILAARDGSTEALKLLNRLDRQIPWDADSLCPDQDYAPP